MSKKKYLDLDGLSRFYSNIMAKITAVSNSLTSHSENKSNPHSVTKSQVGLSSVPNVATNDQAPTYTQTSSLTNLASGEKLSISMGKIMKAIADLIAHKADAVGHITASERTNWNDANGRKHDHSNKTVIDKITQALLDNWSAAYTHMSNKSNPHGVTKAQAGLDKADNTADAEKPVSTAQQTALDGKVDKVTGKQLSTNDYTVAEKTKLAGVATGANNYVHPSTDGNKHIPANGTTNNGKVLKATNTAGAYEWGTLGKAEVGLGSVDNTADANKPVSTAQQTALNAKVTASGGDIADTKVSAFTASATAYPVPVAGETPRVFMGKIKKFFEDIRNAATGACFIGQIVNNCVTNNASLPLSAAQGKVLMDLYTKLNGDINTLNFKFQFKSEIFNNKYIVKDAWTYLGPTGIILSEGYWLITYQVRISSTNSAMDCSIRSTINNNHCQTVKTNTSGHIVSAELTELVYLSSGINNLYPQFYTPLDTTFSNIIMEVACIRLK